jgi:spore coat polysaccharide biosynthesis protein SpsF (cytidylyltransferase family)
MSPEAARDGALAVVQARMSSTRLPGKVLADVDGEPMLALLLTRLIRAHTIDDVVVATSIDRSDDAVAALCRDLGVRAYRGSLTDVLGRVAKAVGGHDGIIVRITADCPLVDPQIVDAVVRLLRASPGSRYACNIEPRTYPDGLDAEALDAGTLAMLDATVTDTQEREHVTLAIRRNPRRYGLVALVGEPNLGDLRWTVDTAADLDFVRAVVSRLGSRRHDAALDEVLNAIRARPSLARMKGGVRG